VPPAALLFGSGYLASVGVISALARPGDVIFSDELYRASIVDGRRLSRAEVFVYRQLRHRAPALGASSRPSAAAR
jgi:7-keto-8-aminopelargonate synthetase-like enzyme